METSDHCPKDNPDVNAADDALEKLIRQFAQPMSFLRELVQNSLDAGTTQVEVTVGTDGPSGLLFVQVRDNGQGMDEEVIDNRLTRLFSSTKENDLTKIGKFGIGFVSIFAVQPELVVLETGGEGESWRVLFKPDRSYEKRELHERVDGTSVTLYLPKGFRRLTDLIKEARETVTFWCKYSSTEILFDGEPINQTFGFAEATYQFHHQEGHTEAMLTPTADHTGFEGYYNRGLTLLEGPGSPFPYVKFRVRSPYLEHTLSRDNILQDKNYQKVMAQVKAAAYEAMPLDIFQRLEESPTDALWEAATSVLNFPGVKERVENYKIIPAQEDAWSLADIPEEIYWRSQIDDFWAAAVELKVKLFLADSRSPILPFLKKAQVSVIKLEDHYLHYSRMEPSEEEEALLTLLEARAPHLTGGFVVEMRSHRPPEWSGCLGVFLNPTKRARSVFLREKGRGDSVALVRGHPLVSRLAKLISREPEIALTVLVRKLNLDLGLGHKGESRILAGSLARVQSQEDKE
jgi:Histidine kinase-, DNA gyrase B-, and HSP90-like ATPase